MSLRVRFGERRRFVSYHDKKFVARHITSDNVCVLEIRALSLCPISGTNDSGKRKEIRLIHTLSGQASLSFI